jgi:hypothetical protein
MWRVDVKPRLTEAEWLAAKTVIHLDLYRSAWKQFRKWRLFGVACCRRVMTLVAEERLEALAAAAEQFADEQIPWDEVKRIRKVMARIRKELIPRNDRSFTPDEAKLDVLDAVNLAAGKTPIGALGADRQSRYAAAAKARPDWQLGHDSEEREQIRLARDIFGNPFRPVAFDPDWHTSTALALAKQMYDSRDFSAMPILADALQDAGCDNDEVLNHCRDAAGVHVRGCWVVDLVLGKS